MSTASTFAPVDQRARERVRDDHGTSFVLEAGAGTGKTTLLIDRLEALLRSGRARLTDVAAVTFTENAATTMKLRLRERLERARAGDIPVAERARAEEALQVLERAQISTIHALCAAILQERPLECGVMPGFRVGDDTESDLVFDEAWNDWLANRLANADPALMEALDEEIPLEGFTEHDERSSLRGLARVLVDQRDLAPLVALDAPDVGAWQTELAEQVARARAALAHAGGDDTLAARLAELAEFADRGRALAGRALLAHLASLVPVKVQGYANRWRDPGALAEARAVADWTRRRSAEWKAARGAFLHGQIVTALRGVVDLYERKKTDRGLLDFLDLLVKTRDALRDRESVRSYFQKRFRFVLIDEFQDTDPLQVEVARLLASAAGGLVVVGDAKQSIYRFRRAEVALFARAAEEARRQPGHAVLQLSQNFRSRPAILRFVNRVFADLIRASDESGQPEYQPIDPPPGLPEGPAVLALRFRARFAEKEDLLRAEAAALARFLRRVADGGEMVRERATGAARKSTAGDAMVLVRRLTQVRHLEEALEAVSLRFAVDGGKSFFDRQEVHEALAVLRAIDDPSDRVSLVAALRSSFLGVSDRDIAAYSLAGGSLRMGPVDPALPGAASVAPAIEMLDGLHRLRTRVSVAALLDRLYDETRILAALTGTRRGEAQIANLEKVASLARQAVELDVLTLRGFAQLLEARMAHAREEPDLPVARPGDPDTVRVLSIHKAKGLESPIVALYDTADDFYVRTDVISLWDEGTVAVGFRAGCQPPRWEALKEREEARCRAEGRRLLYVACTRARDLLVVPRPPSDSNPGSFWRDVWTRLPASSDRDVRVVDDEPLDGPAAPRATEPVLTRVDGDAYAARWDAGRRDLLQSAALRPLQPVSVTRRAGRDAPAAVQAGGGEGRDFGALVHRVLQWVPLSDASPLEAARMAEALAPSFGLDPERARRAGEAAGRTLTLPLLERARRSGRVWREMAVWFPEAADLVEGVVDLVFEEDGALVVVDYKTDSVTAEQALDQAAHHAPQLQLYARGLTQATGMPVRERVVVFTSLGRAVTV
jgi:ATP-dependent exoDNAse (exonuclease V) beta subunit